MEVYHIILYFGHPLPSCLIPTCPTFSYLVTTIVGHAIGLQPAAVLSATIASACLRPDWYWQTLIIESATFVIKPPINKLLPHRLLALIPLGLVFVVSPSPPAPLNPLMNNFCTGVLGTAIEHFVLELVWQILHNIH